MKKIIAILIFSGLSAITLSACTPTQVGTVGGGAAGAGIGYAVTPNSAAGPIIGAGVGALVGNQIGRSYYYRPYYY